VGALRSLPLVICTANINTARDGSVVDVFEVEPDSAAAVSRAQVQAVVAAALAGGGGPGEKKGKRHRH